MQSTDVLIVGGGPAGSTCARALVKRGLVVTVLDKSPFPRDKVCAGWITPAVVDTLGLDLDEYRATGARTLQAITAFRTGLIGGEAVGTRYSRVVSHGIRRSEFDHYLLARSGARMRLGEPMRTVKRDDSGWIVNDELRARVLIGAGGHFCPIARHLGARIGSGETVIAAQEIEYRLDAQQAAQCLVAPECPELYFCDDLKGYGWCFRKGDWLNVGLGREDRHRLASHVEAFCGWLLRERRVPSDLPQRFKGHAYLSYTQAPRALVGNATLLIGDAAGLAYPQSGEGIRPAIESAVFAADVIGDALCGPGARVDALALQRYSTVVQRRFGSRVQRSLQSGAAPEADPGSHPSAWRQALARVALGNRWFSRHVVIDRWFLHRQQAALPNVEQAR
ncbi:MAG: NAD(P)/FAD-dependent oxidoreductase [Proteobacteria bacterium]|nr:NAD(P)/FAD-dependent oxidoreductase [Burkholderiales bacterium]